MSWSGLILRVPAGVSLDELPRDYQPPPLGTPEEIGQTLKDLYPDASHSPQQCGIEGADFWIEFSFRTRNEKSACPSISVRSNAGPGAIPVLRQVCSAFSARLVDVQTSEFADLGIGTMASMSDFSAWRDRNPKP